jgi:hypothetical protein
LNPDDYILYNIGNEDQILQNDFQDNLQHWEDIQKKFSDLSKQVALRPSLKLIEEIISP